MGNKEIIQENNSKLLENNRDLSSILETVNNLPDEVKINLQEKIVTPTIEQQEIVADEDYTALSKVIVDGDADLKPENIKEGVNIFGVEGNAKTTDFKITDARYLFYYGSRLNEMDNILNLCDWDSITNIMYMFYQIDVTELNLSNINTSNVTSMVSMFQYSRKLKSIDLSNFDTRKVTTLQNMFSGCSEIENINISSFDTKNVTNISSMFQYCQKLKSIDLSNFDTRNVESMASMFSRCPLVDLDISNFDMSKCDSISNIVSECSELVNLKFGTNLGKGYTTRTTNTSSYRVDLSYCTKLTHESLMSVINNLYDLNLTYSAIGIGTLYRQELKLGSTNLAKLTAEEIAIATNKGWNVT